MYTIMHISDLHRSEAAYISNEELLSCLFADCQRFHEESPSISIPNAIIVTGDLIQGLPLGSADYPAKLARQYDVALELMIGLAENFLDGDRSRLIIVPGNHDVDWNMAFQSMRRAEHAGGQAQKLLNIPNSYYRWSWDTLELLQITNQAIYKERFRYFDEFYKKFYDGASLAFLVDSTRPWNLFELDDGKIAVCAFNSCVTSDCFNAVGEIPTDAIAQSHMEFLALRRDYSLKIAIWHHDVQGPPRCTDYLDTDSIKLMIDKGYRIGMHGHRHRADTSPYTIHVSERYSMASVGAGSLCAGPYELPTGVNRQYNITEISDSYTNGRLYVREMFTSGIFTRGRLTALGGASHVDLEWSITPPYTMVNTGRFGGHVLAKVERIETLIKAKDCPAAVLLIKRDTDIPSDFRRKLMSEALFEGQMWEKLSEHLSKPINSQELTYSLRARAEIKDWPGGEAILREAKAAKLIPKTTISEIDGWFRAEKGISG